ncbi:hypothetical protein FRX31_006832, partial [Thalictrum thalictroides]
VSTTLLDFTDEEKELLLLEENNTKYEAEIGPTVLLDFTEEEKRFVQLKENNTKYEDEIGRLMAENAALKHKVGVQGIEIKSLNAQLADLTSVKEVEIAAARGEKGFSNVSVGDNERKMAKESQRSINKGKDIVIDIEKEIGVDEMLFAIKNVKMKDLRNCKILHF